MPGSGPFFVAGDEVFARCDVEGHDGFVGIWEGHGRDYGFLPLSATTMEGFSDMNADERMAVWQRYDHAGVVRHLPEGETLHFHEWCGANIDGSHPGVTDAKFNDRLTLSNWLLFMNGIASPYPPPP